MIRRWVILYFYLSISLSISLQDFMQKPRLKPKIMRAVKHFYCSVHKVDTGRILRYIYLITAEEGGFFISLD